MRERRNNQATGAAVLCIKCGCAEGCLHRRVRGRRVGKRYAEPVCVCGAARRLHWSGGGRGCKATGCPEFYERGG